MIFANIISQLLTLSTYALACWPKFLEFYRQNPYSVRAATLIFLWYVYSAVITIVSGLILSVISCFAFMQLYKCLLILRESPTIQNLPWEKAEPVFSTFKSIPEKKQAFVTKVLSIVRSKVPEIRE
uniref:Uncharacterized protein n=1 Tax=Clandestinovirus TaxID=2831644 RepID=A0A8F8KPN3_9VIRU|nr:hypothetical protein KOM_12_498 [Clandestinovirus]